MFLSLIKKDRKRFIKLVGLSFTVSVVILITFYVFFVVNKKTPALTETFYNGENDYSISSNIIDVKTERAINIEDSKADLIGEIHDIEENSVDVWFEWGDTRELRQSTSLYQKTEQGYFSHTISDLKPNQNYYFRAVAKQGPEVEYGEIFSFNTFPGKIEIETTSSSGVKATEAIIRGEIIFVNEKDKGRVRFSYGENGNHLKYQTEWERREDSGKFSYKIVKLDPGKKYSFIAEGENDSSHGVGDILSFETKYFNIISGSLKEKDIENIIQKNEGKFNAKVVKAHSKGVVVNIENKSQVEFFFNNDFKVYINPVSEREETLNSFLDNYDGEGCPEISEEMVQEFRLKEGNSKDIESGEEITLFFFGYKSYNNLVDRIVINK